MVEIILIVLFAVFIIDLARDAFKEKQKNKVLNIKGIELEFDFPETQIYEDAVQSISEDILNHLSEEGYKIYVLKAMYSKLFKLEKKMKCNFKIEFCHEAFTCIHIDKENKIIFMKESDGVDALVGVLKSIYFAVPVKETKNICGIKVVIDADKGSETSVAEGLLKFPKYVLDIFSKENYILYVLNPEAFKEKYGEEDCSEVAGYHYPKGKEIVLKQEPFKNQFLSTLYHEFGHFIDRYSAEEKGCSFATVYNKDIEETYMMAKQKYADKIGKYYLSTEGEFFAYLSSEYFGEKDMIDKDFKVVFERSLAIMSERA